MTDYLSFLTLRMKNCPTMPNLDGQDYVILNSVSNVCKAIDVLHGYERVHCLLDNDEAGRKAYWELAGEFAGRIRDFSQNYNGHKDLNDYLCGKPLSQSAEPLFGLLGDFQRCLQCGSDKFPNKLRYFPLANIRVAASILFLHLQPPLFRWLHHPPCGLVTEWRTGHNPYSTGWTPQD